MQKVKGVIFAVFYFESSFIFPLRYCLYGSSWKISISYTLVRD